jgi:hypothetical protein
MRYKLKLLGYKKPHSPSRTSDYPPVSEEILGNPGNPGKPLFSLCLPYATLSAPGLSLGRSLKFIPIYLQAAGGPNVCLQSRCRSVEVSVVVSSETFHQKHTVRTQNETKQKTGKTSADKSAVALIAIQMNQKMRRVKNGSIRSLANKGSQPAEFLNGTGQGNDLA